MQFDFLICSERSGSNLITKVMDGHPEVCGPFPSHMMRTFAPNYFRYGDLAQDAHWRDLTDDAADYLSNIFAQWESSVTPEELREHCGERSLAAIVRYVYEKEAQTRGKRRVFVKENHAYRFIPFTLAAFPESRFVWLVRDPRDMALCQRDSILRGGVQSAVAAWKPDQAETLKVYGYLKDAGKVLLLKFEDLLSDSEGTCRRLCDFLELEFSPAMLEFYKDANVARNAGAISAWSDLAKPIISDNFNNYRKGLSEIEIRYVEAVCQEEMVFLGYEPDFEIGYVDALRVSLPDESRFEVARSETERQRYTPFGEANKRLHDRWSAKAAELS